jgi:tetratricopeptide (TPR) repeat protein
MLLKRFDEAISQVTSSLEIDPNNALVQVLAAVVSYGSGETQRALELAEKSYQIDPHSLLVLRTLDMCYYRLGEYDQSIEMQKRLQNNDPQYLKALEEGYIHKDYKNAMLALARTKEKLSGQQYAQSGWVAIIYNRAGSYEDAIKWLERGIQMHDQDMPYIYIMDEFKELEKDERFRKIAQKINVPLL